jgi:hypothetical protein
MHYTMRVSVFFGLAMVIWATSVMASTGTTFDGAAVTLNNMFILAAFLLEFAGTAGLVYSIAQRTYGLIFDGAIALLLAAGVCASWPTLGGLVGVSQAATLVP